MTQATVKGRNVKLEAASTLTDSSPSVGVLTGITQSAAAATIDVDSSQITAAGGNLTMNAASSQSLGTHRPARTREHPVNDATVLTPAVNVR